LRKIRETLRLRLHARLSQREIAQTANVAQSTVNDYVGRAQVAKLTWPLPPELDNDETLNRLLFPAEHHPVARRQFDCPSPPLGDRTSRCRAR